MTNTVELSEVEVSPAPLEYRSAQLVDVRFPDRVIEVVAMPYGEGTVVPYKGAAVMEFCDRGAWDGIERRANRVKVNREHDVQRTVGRATALYPSRDVGLVAELRIANTVLGDETLELAADGVLDASCAFAPMPGGVRWSSDKRERHLTRCWLGHIAMVPDPAYDGARVLEVRHDVDVAAMPVTVAVVVATPLKDAVLARLRAVGYIPPP